MDFILTNTAFSSPAIFAAAIIAVAFVGLAKGGLAGFGLLGVPILALYMPPLQAAALLLPSYLIMDAVALWTWRRYKNWQLIKDVLPSAVLGIIAGAFFASVISDAAVKLIIGVITLLFVARRAFLAMNGRVPAAKREPKRATFWGAISGFTSFIAHAGGPPFQVYALPLRLDPKILTGSSAIIFAVLNALKIVPYFLLGEFGSHIWASTLVLIPFTVLFVLIGAWIVKQMRADIFYPLTYAMVSIVALKLIYDGLASM